ncbi:hypothetical protein V6N13_019024 [Hibiscus sabdariffa]
MSNVATNLRLGRAKYIKVECNFGGLFISYRVVEAMKGKEEKCPNGWDDVDVNVFPRDLLSDVLMCKEVWPFSGEGNEQIARILLGNEDEPYNFFVEYTDVCACPWKYCEEDVP